ncbi:MAG: Hsp20/alpha crystallin family protein [Calditrichaeota bacterium]|nr:MAG: Hsp20/alpha crystallin family protein [Calditrichota bacterium]
MAIRDLLPRNWLGKRQVPVRREEAFDPFLALRREMDRLFDRFYNEFGLTRWDEGWGEVFPRVDVKETDREVVVTAELPGIDEKDLDISVSDDVLTLRGEKREEREEREGNFYRMERSYGTFHRDIALPCEVDPDKVEAVYRKGVLTIHLPKKEESRRRAKRIAIKTS